MQSRAISNGQKKNANQNMVALHLRYDWNVIPQSVILCTCDEICQSIHPRTILRLDSRLGYFIFENGSRRTPGVVAKGSMCLYYCGGGHGSFVWRSY
mmetsp:Transcript_4559/g.9007  ORF Transcript_4559/g.9007 Transcript_4559/m.9007 type:complete len:97 (-) Transcript_4559:823-1113(-)